MESINTPALICPKCAVDVENAVKLKKIALIADKFFRSQETCQTDEYECLKSQQLKVEEDEEEVEVYAIVEDDIDELIEYDDTIEGGDQFELEQSEENYSEGTLRPRKIKSQRKPYAPRKPGGGRQVHQCECGIIFSSNQRLKNHVIVKHSVVPLSEMLSCDLCEKKFKIQEYLDLHKRNLHSNSKSRERQKYPCRSCGSLLSSLVALKNHEEKHLIDNHPEDQVKKFHCDSCGLSFRLKSYLFNHMHNVHIRQKYICQFCERGFYKRYEMNDHIRQQHTMETPFECEFEGCQKSFARKKNYLIHKVSWSAMNYEMLKQVFPANSHQRASVQMHIRRLHKGVHTLHRPQATHDETREI